MNELINTLMDIQVSMSEFPIVTQLKLRDLIAQLEPLQEVNKNG